MSSAPPNRIVSRPLFVYGTLRHGHPNRYARLLERSARYLGTARIPGRLYRISWYPGVRVRRSRAEWVVGDLFRLRNPSMLAKLDQYEGAHEYHRISVQALLPDGTRMHCWVYEYIGGIMQSRRVESGDWFHRSP